MSLFFLLSGVSAIATLAHAEEDFLERVYRGTFEVLTSEKCLATPPQTESADCVAPPATVVPPKLEPISDALESTYYDDLAGFELERLSCSIAKHESLAQQKDAAAAALQRVNEKLPYLSDLNKKINELVGKNQLLAGDLGQRNEAYSNIPFSPQKKARIAEYDLRNNDIKQLMTEYERSLAELPGSDLPAVRKMIESHFEGKFSDLKPFDEKDFAKMGALAIEKLKESKEELAQTNKPPSKRYDLSFDDKSRFGTDPDLIAELLKKHPDQAGAIHSLECRAKARSKGKDVLAFGTLILPIGSLALVKAARTAYSAHKLNAARKFAAGSRVFGWAALGVGSYQGFKAISEHCSKGRGYAANECSVSLKSLAEEHSLYDCISSSLLAGLNVAGGAIGTRLSGALARSYEGKSKAVNDFVATSIRRGKEGRDLAAASNLDDTQRIAAAEGLLSNLRGTPVKLTKQEADSILRAHSLGKGFGKNDADDYAKIEAELEKGGFGWRERKLFMGKGITGQAADPLKVPPLPFGQIETEFVRLKDAAGKDKPVENLSKTVDQLDEDIKALRSLEAEGEAARAHAHNALNSGGAKSAETKKTMNDAIAAGKAKKEAAQARLNPLLQLRNRLEEERAYLAARQLLANQGSTASTLDRRAAEVASTRSLLSSRVDSVAQEAVNRAPDKQAALRDVADLLSQARQSGINVEKALQKAQQAFADKFPPVKAGTEQDLFVNSVIKRLIDRSAEYITKTARGEWQFHQANSDLRLAKELAEKLGESRYSGNIATLQSRLKDLETGAKANNVDLERVGVALSKTVAKSPAENYAAVPTFRPISN